MCTGFSKPAKECPPLLSGFQRMVVIVDFYSDCKAVVHVRRAVTYCRMGTLRARKFSHTFPDPSPRYCAFDF